MGSNQEEGSAANHQHFQNERMDGHHQSTTRDREPLTSDGINSGDVTLRTRYVYKKIRFTNSLRIFIAVDAIVTIVLWLAGGNSKYMIDSITDFTIVTSVFDLAVIWLIKLPVYLMVVNFIESAVMKSFDIPLNATLQKRLQSLFLKFYALSLAVFAYAVVKGSLVLRDFVNNGDNDDMHQTYNACCIWCVVSSTIILVLTLLSSKLMQRMKNARQTKYYDSQGREVDKDGKRISSKASLARLASLAKPEASLIFTGMVMLLVSTGVQTVAPLYFGKVVDAAQRSMDDLNETVVVLLCIYLAGSVASLFRSWMFNLAGQRLVARLREKLFGSIIQQEVAFFDTNRTGELCNRLSSDTQVLQNAITVNVSMLFRYSLQIVGSLALMFYLNPALTGVLLAVVPVVSLTAMRYGKFVRSMRKKFQDKLADAGTKAEEALSSVRTVKSFSGEMREKSEYGKNVQESYQIGKKLALAQGLMDGLFSILAYGAIGAVLWYGGKLVNDNTHDSNKGITPGLLTSFLLYTLQVAMGFALLSSIYGDFMQAVGASSRIFTLLDRAPDMEMPDQPVVLPTLTADIEFTEVGFTYPSRPESKVLKDISFQVKPGQMVALVGPSGGGKSTIVNLIERFYDPAHGNIKIGGEYLKSLDMTWFRQKISMVSQEPTLFACSIRDNIAYGRGATDEEVTEAAKQANAHEFISAFEDGYNTLVGERGVRLSGGQKQRVAIARALIMNPALLLLDEATSALDAESEHLVQEAIDRAMKDRTVIVIAHRLSTVRNAHKVVVIDKGEIAEMGTHVELLAKNSVYKRLVMRQLAVGQDPQTAKDGEEEDEDDDKDDKYDGTPKEEEIAKEEGEEVDGGDDDDDAPLVLLTDPDKQQNKMEHDSSGQLSQQVRKTFTRVQLIHPSLASFAGKPSSSKVQLSRPQRFLNCSKIGAATSTRQHKTSTTMKTHSKARTAEYPGSSVQRSPVPDDKVSWVTEFPDYSPVEYTADIVLQKPVWADVVEKEIELNPINFNGLDGIINRRSHLGDYDIVENIPRNPIGRTGMRGRGLLGRWGPNHAADPIVTRWKKDKNGSTVKVKGKPVLQFIAIQRRDNGQWAIPGGMVNAGEVVTITIRREFAEESLNSLEATPEEKKSIEAAVDQLFAHGVEVYRGYVDDPRNTDNAWMETVAMNFHDNDGTSVSKFNLHAGDDATHVKWIDLSSDLEVYASHIDFLLTTAQRHNASW